MLYFLIAVFYLLFAFAFYFLFGALAILAEEKTGRLLDILNKTDPGNVKDFALAKSNYTKTSDIFETLSALSASSFGWIISYPLIIIYLIINLVYKKVKINKIFNNVFLSVALWLREKFNLFK